MARLKVAPRPAPEKGRREVLDSEVAHRLNGLAELVLAAPAGPSPLTEAGFYFIATALEHEAARLARGDEEVDA